MVVIVLKINLDYKPDDSCGWITAGVYDFYPSKAQVMERLEENGIVTDEIVIGKQVDFIETQFYKT